MKDITVSRLTAPDVTPALAEQLREVFAALEEEQIWDIEHGRGFLEHPDNALWVAWADDRAVGFISAHKLLNWDQYGPEVLVYDLAVLEDYRRRGAARSLLETVKSWAAENGADDMWVLTDKGNTPARTLYASAGGEEDTDVTLFEYPLGQNP